MTTAIFVILLLGVALLAMKFGRVFTAMTLSCLVGVAIASGPLGVPARAAMDGIRTGVTAAADAMFSGTRR